MTKREIALLSFKVLGAYAFIQAIDKSYYILYYLIYKNQFDVASKLNLVLTSVPTLLSAMCGILLWYTAPSLAATIFKSITPEDGSQASLADVQIVAFSVVGLFVLATGFPDLVNVVVVMLTGIQGGNRAMIHNLVVLVLKIALGLWLLLGSHGLVKFIRSAQRD